MALGLGVDPTDARVARLAASLRCDDHPPDLAGSAAPEPGSRALAPHAHATRREDEAWEAWERRPAAEMFLWPPRLRPWPPSPLQLAVHEAEAERAYDWRQRDRGMPVPPRLEFPADAWAEWLAEWEELGEASPSPR